MRAVNTKAVTMIGAAPEEGMFKPVLNIARSRLAKLPTFGDFAKTSRSLRQVFSWPTYIASLVVVRLQEIPSASIYRNSSQNRAKLSLVFFNFSAVR